MSFAMIASPVVTLSPQEAPPIQEAIVPGTAKETIEVPAPQVVETITAIHMNERNSAPTIQLLLYQFLRFTSKSRNETWSRFLMAPFFR